MEIEAPTFNALNKPQKRALILRDQLRYTDPRHLNSFIEGLADDEPPTYRKVNGVTQPPLKLVTLTSTATRFDLGNVLFPEENNAIHRVFLTVENGRFEMVTEEGLPHNDADLASVPIHGFIAKTMVPMFKEKFQAITARQNKINEARRVAFNMPNQPATHFDDGPTLARLDPFQVKQNGETALTKRPKKRKPGDAVVKHACNKRSRIGLDSIPEVFKSAAFNTIPEHIKLDLFNNISRTAFPHFDNLMMASWNLVSVYSAVGTDFPELHKAVVELKHVLVDFDETFGLKIDRIGVRYRADFDPATRTGKDSQHALLPLPTPLPPPALNARQDIEAATGQVREEAAVKGVITQQEDEGITAIAPKEQSLIIHHTRHIPSPPQPYPHPEDDEKSEEESFQNLFTPGPSTKDVRRADSTSRTHPKTSSTTSVGLTQPSPTPQLSSKKPRDEPTEPPIPSSVSEDTTSPEHARRREEYASSVDKTNKHISAAAARESSVQKKKKSLADLPIAELHQKYRDRQAKLTVQYGSIENAPPNQRDFMRQVEEMISLREHDETEAVQDDGERHSPWAERQRMVPAQTRFGSQGQASTLREVEETESVTMQPPRRGDSLGSSAAGPYRRPPIPGVGMAGSYLSEPNLGQSMLGHKKPMGNAPVAPMMGTRKEGNGYGNGYEKNSGSGGRRYGQQGRF